MRKWCLVPLLVLLLLVQALLLACSGDDIAGPGEDNDGSRGDPAATDGLRTTTTLAPAAWEELTPKGDAPNGRLGSSVYYDSANDRLLIFGGWVGGATFSSAVWSYDLTSASWTASPTEGEVPSGRASHAWAYDPVSDRLVVFGGYDGTHYYNDTWAYDPTEETWTPLQPLGNVPHAREGHSLVYDPESKRMILFGGYDGTIEYADTWAYEPATNTWNELDPDGDTPPARDSHRMVYNPDDEVMVMFAGWSTTTQFNDTWAYDPAEDAWKRLDPSGDVPVARALHAMTYDLDVKKVVLFGGGTSTTVFGDTWNYDYPSNTWTEARLDSAPPTARAGHVLASASEEPMLVLFGGSDATGDFLDDLWTLSR